MFSFKKNMKKIIYTLILVLILSCNKKLERNGDEVSRVEGVKAQVGDVEKKEDTLTKTNLDSISKESSKENIETILSLGQKLLGKWELMDFESNEEHEVEEKPSGVIWIFKENHICEERKDPSNPNDVTVYEYEISNISCEEKKQSKEFLYINLTNKTVAGEDYCFSISINQVRADDDSSEILSLYTWGAISPDILKRR